MKYIITESKLENVVFRWLDEEFGDLDIIDSDRYPEDIQYEKNGDLVFNYNTRTHRVLINYSTVWSYLKNLFGLSNKQIEEITKKWIEDRYRIPVILTFTYTHTSR